MAAACHGKLKLVPGWHYQPGVASQILTKPGVHLLICDRRKPPVSCRGVHRQHMEAAYRTCGSVMHPRTHTHTSSADEPLKAAAAGSDVAQLLNSVGLHLPSMRAFYLACLQCQPCLDLFVLSTIHTVDDWPTWCHTTLPRVLKLRCNTKVKWCTSAATARGKCTLQ